MDHRPGRRGAVSRSLSPSLFGLLFSLLLAPLKNYCSFFVPPKTSGGAYYLSFPLCGVQDRSPAMRESYSSTPDFLHEQYGNRVLHLFSLLILALLHSGTVILGFSFNSLFIFIFYFF